MHARQLTRRGSCSGPPQVAQVHPLCLQHVHQFLNATPGGLVRCNTLSQASFYLPQILRKQSRDPAKWTRLARPAAPPAPSKLRPLYAPRPEEQQQQPEEVEVGVHIGASPRTHFVSSEQEGVGEVVVEEEEEEQQPEEVGGAVSSRP